MTEREQIALQAIEGRRPNSAGYAKGNCPFCIDRQGKEDTTRAFWVEVATGWYGCHRCKVKGKIDSMADLPELPDEDPEDRRSGPPDGFEPLWTPDGLTAVVLRTAREYLEERVPRRLWEPLQVGACLSGRFGGRVVIPVINRAGEWVGHVARAWSKLLEPKYLNETGMVTADTFWNEQVFDDPEAEELLVVEGAFDAIAHWPDAVACMGKLKPEQIEVLAGLGRPVVLCPDGDAWEEGWAQAIQLKFRGVPCGSIRLPPRVDPDQVPAGDMRRAKRLALVRGSYDL